jgi:pimeloyl-ACP methyl ester carboxylesterase
VSRLRIWTKRALKLAVLAIPGAALFVAVRSYRIEAASFSRQRRPVPLPAAALGLRGLEAVAFPSRAGVLLRGWYVPSENRAGVVLAHGAGGDRRSLIQEALALHRHGFGTLLFDWPGHGESEGEIHWNEGERAALRGAVDFLSARADLDPKRLGAFGFSMGGYTVAQVAADEPRLRATALAGAPPDAEEQTRWEYRRWGALAQIPALLAVKASGLPVGTLRPKDTVSRISPRALLIIGGTEDGLVPQFMTEELFAAAKEPKQLLLIERAGHGGYGDAAPEVYPQQLVAFFERALLGFERDREPTSP